VYGWPLGWPLKVTGPPFSPLGSMVAVIPYSRFDQVGPSTEQWYWSQTVNASASAYGNGRSSPA